MGGTTPYIYTSRLTTLNDNNAFISWKARLSEQVIAEGSEYRPKLLLFEINARLAHCMHVFTWRY